MRFKFISVFRAVFTWSATFSAALFDYSKKSRWEKY